MTDVVAAVVAVVAAGGSGVPVAAVYCKHTHFLPLRENAPWHLEAAYANPEPNGRIRRETHHS